MKVKFVAQIENSLRFSNPFEIISENPETVLEALEQMGFEVPTIQRLLNHMFVDRAAYCKPPYTIIIRSE